MSETEPIHTDEEPAHDVLAAEEFAMPARDPELSHSPVVLPDDPSGIAEPHDVLAAEEFAMPAPRQSRVGDVIARTATHPHTWKIAVIAAAGAIVAFVLARVLRRES